VAGAPGETKRLPRGEIDRTLVVPLFASAAIPVAFAVFGGLGQR